MCVCVQDAGSKSFWNSIFNVVVDQYNSPLLQFFPSGCIPTLFGWSSDHTSVTVYPASWTFKFQNTCRQ